MRLASSGRASQEWLGRDGKGWDRSGIAGVESPGEESTAEARQASQGWAGHGADWQAWIVAERSGLAGQRIAGKEPPVVESSGTES